MLPPPHRSTPFPYTTLFRSRRSGLTLEGPGVRPQDGGRRGGGESGDRLALPVAGKRLPLVVETEPALHPLLGERGGVRSEEHTSELQSPYDIVCRLLLEKKN